MHRPVAAAPEWDNQSCLHTEVSYPTHTCVSGKVAIQTGRDSEKTAAKDHQNIKGKDHEALHEDLEQAAPQRQFGIEVPEGDVAGGEEDGHEEETDEHGGSVEENRVAAFRSGRNLSGNRTNRELVRDLLLRAVNM